jgi:hypothetical protein
MCDSASGYQICQALNEPAPAWMPRAVRAGADAPRVLLAQIAPWRPALDGVVPR